MRKTMFGELFALTLVTGSPRHASIALACGVNRIGVDLEHIGKANRQTGFSGRLSRHSLHNLQALAEMVERDRLLARINPLHDGSEKEIDSCIQAGAGQLMLPYFSTPEELKKFLGIIDGRVAACALVETPAALLRVEGVLAVEGVQEIMIGLNDLRIGFGVHNHFEVLCSPILERIGEVVTQAGVKFTIGGVAPPAWTGLPVSPDLVLAQYPRLRAEGAWISRSFSEPWPGDKEFGLGIQAIRNRLDQWAGENEESLEKERRSLQRQSEMFRQAGGDQTS